MKLMWLMFMMFLFAVAESSEIYAGVEGDKNHAVAPKGAKEGGYGGISRDMMDFKPSSASFPRAYAASDDQIHALKRAENYYHEGLYDRALALYEQSSLEGPAVWYNRGNAAYMMGNDKDALIFWGRAARTARGTLLRDALANQDVVLRKWGVPVDSWAHQWYAISLVWYRSVPPIVWQILLICLIIALSIVWYRWLVQKRYGRLFVMCFFAFFLAISSIRYYYQAHCGVGFVAYTDVGMYAGPDEQYQLMGTLAQGARVKVLSSRDGFSQVQSGGVVGWVVTNTLALI